MGKTIEPYTDKSLTHFCAVCDAEIAPGEQAYDARKQHNTYASAGICCSMECARKALGVEEHNLHCVSRHADCFYDGCRTQCVNYKPESDCANYEPEDKAEAEVWEWRKSTIPGNWFLESLSPARSIIVHAPCTAKELSLADRELIRQAPQTAKKLEKAYAENAWLWKRTNWLSRDNTKLGEKLKAAEAENATLKARIASLETMAAARIVELEGYVQTDEENVELREALRAARAYIELVESENEYNNTGRLVVNKIDAALGKEDA